MRLAAEARSGADWPAYDQFDGVTNAAGHTYRSTVPAAVVVDADVQQTLLNRRLTATVSVRNVLNVEEQTHPLGASLARRLLVQAALRL
jgi:hypothetical protein